MGTVLLIEDSELLHQLLKKKLESANLAVVSAFDGEEGISKAREMHPNIILLDLLLPKKHGVEIFNRLQQDPTTASIPIFVISNSGKPEEIEFLKEKGIAGYVVKAKVEPGEIVSAVCKQLGLPDPKDVPAEPVVVPEYVGPASAKKVLVAEDDLIIAELINSRLQKNGYRTALARDGFEALASVEHEKPDLVLLDLVMPKKDGFEVLGELRQNEQLKNVPILVTSNLSEQREVNKSKLMGAAEYLVKAECTPEEITRIVDRYMQRAQ